MTVFTRILLAPALAVLVVVGEASPQAYRTAVGYGGGGVFVTPLNAGASGGAEELRLEAGWIMGAELEHRVGSGWLGLRLHGAYTQRPFALEGRTLGINMWLVDAGIVLRPSSPGRERGVSPFLGVGGGLVTYRFGRGSPVEIEEANARYPGDNERQWAGVVGVGLDLGPVLEIQETPLGLRLEVADHVAFRSPFDPISGERFDPVHNVRVTLSLVSMVGELPRLR